MKPDDLEIFAKTSRDIPDYCRLPLLTLADYMRAQAAEIARLTALAEDYKLRAEAAQVYFGPNVEVTGKAGTPGLSG